MHANQASYLSPKLEVRAHPQKGGLGVFTRQPVKAGEVLAVWSGDLCDGERFNQLSRERQRRSLQVEENLYLVTSVPDEPADYINHSCDPNAGIDGQIVLRAMRAIAPNEEICFDYAMSDGSAYDEFECACGSLNCRHWITGNDWRYPDLQTKYAGWFSSYLQRRIDQQREKVTIAGSYPANGNGNGRTRQVS